MAAMCHNTTSSIQDVLQNNLESVVCSAQNYIFGVCHRQKKTLFFIGLTNNNAAKILI